MPPHTPGCYVCGDANPKSLGLSAAAGEDDSVKAVHTFARTEQGAPGVAHGGAVGAVIDDLFGFVLMRLLVPGVTRDLQIRFRRPIALGVPVHLRAGLTSRDDRHLRMAATGHQGELLVVEAEATFTEVDIQHLADPTARRRQPPPHPR